MNKLAKLTTVGALAMGLVIQSVTPQAFAATEEPMIRIGVAPSGQTVTLGGQGEFQVIDKVTKEVLAEGDDETARVELTSTSMVQTNYRLQVAFTSNTATMNDLLQRAENLGYPTHTVPFNGGFRIYIGEFAPDASFTVRTAFKNELIAAGLAASDAYWTVVTIAEGEKELEITLGDVTFTTENPVQLISEEDTVTINGKLYRGLAEANYNSAGTLAGINELSLEHYLYGVVPHELPPVPYGELEAQKSQAIAARTYAMSNMGKRGNDGYDLLATTSDQVYSGKGIEHPISTQAIDETRGKVATYNGKYITAVYHSTSGGVTANNEDIWNSEATPYLRGTHVAQKGNSLKYVPALDIYKKNGAGESLREVKKGDFEADWSRYYRWHFEWTPEEMSEVLSLYYNQDVGKVLEVNTISRSSSGRVAEIEFVTENGTFYEYKDRIRWALQYINANGAPAVLLSTLFILETEKEEDGTITGFSVNGGGWGHGVGMSQVGAVGMAEAGYSHEVILKHFYKGIDLEIAYE